MAADTRASSRCSGVLADVNNTRSVPVGVGAALTVVTEVDCAPLGGGATGVGARDVIFVAFAVPRNALNAFKCA